jgi:hypothetical protein
MSLFYIKHQEWLFFSIHLFSPSNSISKGGWHKRFKLFPGESNMTWFKQVSRFLRTSFSWLVIHAVFILSFPLSFYGKRLSYDLRLAEHPTSAPQYRVALFDPQCCEMPWWALSRSLWTTTDAWGGWTDLEQMHGRWAHQSTLLFLMNTNSKLPIK